MQSLRLLWTARLENSDQAGNARPAFFMSFFDTVGLACEVLAVIRTPAPRLRFIASSGLNAELHQAVGRSPVLRGYGDFFLSDETTG